MAALLSEQGKLLVFARAAALLLMAFTFFSEAFLRPNVVPFDEYIESTWLICFFVISGFGLINFLAMDYDAFDARDPGKKTHFQYYSAQIGVVMLFAVCFPVFLQSSFPSLVLRFTGSHTTVELKIRGLNPNRDRKYCVQGVYLRNKPYFADDICGIDPSILRTLRAGDTIVVSGNGNWMGLIPEQVAYAPWDFRAGRN